MTRSVVSTPAARRKITVATISSWGNGAPSYSAVTRSETRSLPRMPPPLLDDRLEERGHLLASAERRLAGARIGDARDPARDDRPVPVAEPGGLVDAGQLRDREERDPHRVLLAEVDGLAEGQRVGSRPGDLPDEAVQALAEGPLAAHLTGHDPDLLVVLAPAHLEERPAERRRAGALLERLEPGVVGEDAAHELVTRRHPRVEAPAPEERTLGPEAVEHGIAVDRGVTVDDGGEAALQLCGRRCHRRAIVPRDRESLQTLPLDGRQIPHIPSTLGGAPPNTGCTGVIPAEGRAHDDRSPDEVGGPRETERGERGRGHSPQRVPGGGRRESLCGRDRAGAGLRHDRAGGFCDDRRDPVGCVLRGRDLRPRASDRPPCRVLRVGRPGPRDAAADPAPLGAAGRCQVEHRREAEARTRGVLAH